MAFGALVLLPPVIVFVTAAITHRVLTSLSLGIAAAALITAQGNIFEAITIAASRIVYQTIALDHLYTFGFLVALGIIIQIITHTGGMSAYTRIISKKLSNSRSVQTTSLGLSCIFLLDDYLNSLTVGSIMRPLTDRFEIPRIKLAYLLNSMSSPLAALVPATSWTAVILTQLQASGISQTSDALVFEDPLVAYLKALPFLFYSIFAIAAAWFIVRTQRSFGSMAEQEKIAQKTHNLFGGKAPLSITAEHTHDGTIADFLIPIITFVLGIFGTMMCAGNILEADPLWALFMGGCFSLIISVGRMAILRKKELFRMPQISREGFDVVKNSMILLLLAWTLGSFMKDDLQTGQHLASALLGNVSALYIPVVVLITSVVIAASVGSSWATIVLMLPLTIPMIVTSGALSLLSITIGAVIGGAVAGAHFSPIADGMVCASLSAGAYHLDFVRAQISYAIPVLIGSAVATLAASLLISTLGTAATAIFSIALGLIVTLGIITALSKKSK